MKKVFVIVLVSLILLQCGIKSMYVAYYNINKEYIASVLCINKAKPASTCNGKCYLSKKMDQQEKQEQTIPSALKGLEEAIFYFTDFSLLISPKFSFEEQLVSLDAYQMHSYLSPIDNIIEPPQ